MRKGAIFHITSLTNFHSQNLSVFFTVAMRRRPATQTNVPPHAAHSQTTAHPSNPVASEKAGDHYPKRKVASAQDREMLNGDDSSPLIQL